MKIVELILLVKPNSEGTYTSYEIKVLQCGAVVKPEIDQQT